MIEIILKFYHYDFLQTFTSRNIGFQTSVSPSRSLKFQEIKFQTKEEDPNTIEQVEGNDQHVCSVKSDEIQ